MMMQHTTNLPFAIDPSSAPSIIITQSSSPTTTIDTTTTTHYLHRIESSDSMNTIISSLSSSLSSSSLVSLVPSSRTFCGPHENDGFIPATPQQQLPTEIESNHNPILNCSPGGRSIIEFTFHHDNTTNGDGIPERLLVPVI
eukprot:CAMPEP_0171019564 /NCGR_PEP_ID=MMETSP0736-20130129/29203_1 /TAXON_ID=186038 /ORGANISM="Fragilariopsis kerguelensis, Strain L26-C5" /LENGTH=141 /DNA_ID=CAMNT_0011456815 /DNA_START=93 /DNA_END=518 /DNA_ORIENTATION=-